MINKKLHSLVKKYLKLNKTSKIPLYQYGLLMKEAGFQEFQAVLYITNILKLTSISNIDIQINTIKQAYKFEWDRTKVHLKSRTLIGKYTLDEWENKLKEYNYSCAYCGKTNIKLTKDHVIPVSKGGENTIDNIVPACWECNYNKRALALEDFNKINH